MQQCKHIGCRNHVAEANADFCTQCTNGITSTVTTAKEARQLAKQLNLQESSGGDNDYWIARITNPKRLDPYEAECEDIIEHFQMTFQEGEAFKALWRKGQLRIGNGKPGDTHLRNAEKVAHFGPRMVAMEKKVLEC